MGAAPGASTEGLRAPRAFEASAWSAWLFRALLFVVFVGVFPFLRAINNPNENVRVYMTMAIVDHGTFRVDDVVAMHGHTNDLARAPDAHGEFHRYSVKAPATSYVGVPVYAAFRAIAPRFGLARPAAPTANAPGSPPEARDRWFRWAVAALRLFTVQLPCFFALLAFERWLRRISSDAVLRYATVVAAGVGTNHLASALLFASHAPVAWATFGSFAVVMGSARPRLGRAFVAGILAGLATLLEYHALPMSVALALVALVRYRAWRPVVAFGVGAATQAGALMFYQWRAYGNPFTPGHKMCESQEFASAHAKGLFGIELPDPVAFRELSWNRTFGFFATSPFMVLGLLALPVAILWARGRVRRWRGHAIAAFGVMMPLWLAVSAFVSWRGGWTIGPRFFGAAPPFFAFLALVVLEAVASRAARWRTIARGIAAGLACAGVFSLGIVGAIVSSLPESIDRPLVDVAIPFLAAGIVPHHLGELVGLGGVGAFYAVLACLFGVALLPLAIRAGDGVGSHAGRTLAFAFALAAGLVPALAPPSGPEALEAARGVREFFARYWEPAGRSRLDAIAAKERAGIATACDYARRARIERLFAHDDAATRDAQSAAERGGCSSALTGW